MKAIKLTLANSEPIVDALSAVNGRADRWTLQHYYQVANAADDAEDRLDDLGVLKKHRPGTRAVHVGGTPVRSKYSGGITTKITLERRSSGWFLVDVERFESDGGAEETTLHLGPDAGRAVVKAALAGLVIDGATAEEVAKMAAGDERPFWVYAQDCPGFDDGVHKMTEEEWEERLIAGLGNAPATFDYRGDAEDYAREVNAS